MSKEIAKSDIISGIIQLWIFTILGVIIIYGMYKENQGVYDKGLFALGVTGAGYIVKTVANNSKILKAVQEWLSQYMPNIFELLGNKRSTEVIKNDGLMVRAMATQSDLTSVMLAKLEAMAIQLDGMGK